MQVWPYLKSIALLLQADDVLLQRAAGFLLLLLCRSKLLLQSMALSRHLAHLNLDTQTQALATYVQRLVFKTTKSGSREGASITLEVSSCWWMPSSSPFREACCTRRELSCKQARTYDRCRTNNMDSTNIFKAQMLEIKRELCNIQSKIIGRACTHTPVSWHQPSPFWSLLAIVLSWTSSPPPGPAATSKPLQTQTQTHKWAQEHFQ